MRVIARLRFVGGVVVAWGDGRGHALLRSIGVAEGVRGSAVIAVERMAGAVLFNFLRQQKRFLPPIELLAIGEALAFGRC